MQKFNINRILDGGLGHEIRRRGFSFKMPQWSAQVLIDKPEALVDIYTEYVNNGAQIITTNTYATVPCHLGEEVFKERGNELIQLAGEQARIVKEMNPEKNIQIAFSVPPILGSYRPDLFKDNEKEAHELYEKFLEPSYAMDYVDFYLCETLSSVREARFLMELLQKNPKPYCLSFTFDDDTLELRDKDEKIEALPEAIRQFEKKPEAVMINCLRPEGITKIIQRLRSCLPKEILVGCYPNNFQKKKRDNYDPKKQGQSNFTVQDDIELDQFAKYVRQWRQNGADIVGGCCGIGPRYLPAIKKVFDEMKEEEKEEK